MSTEKVLRIGDKMRLSLELAADLHVRRSDESLIVEVVDIRDGEPGLKTLVLKNCKPDPDARLGATEA